LISVESMASLVRLRPAAAAPLLAGIPDTSQDRSQGIPDTRNLPAGATAAAARAVASGSELWMIKMLTSDSQAESGRRWGLLFGLTLWISVVAFCRPRVAVD
jgi:hypothetical protein